MDDQYYDIERRKLLFISPEALIKNEEFSKAISEANTTHYLKNIVIDEAHIVVEWGDFFRTDYQALEPWRKKLIEDNPDIRTILLSATIDNNTGFALIKEGIRNDRMLPKNHPERSLLEEVDVIWSER